MHTYNHMCLMCVWCECTYTYINILLNARILNTYPVPMCVYRYIYIWNLRVDPKQGFYIIFAVQFWTRLIPMCPWDFVWQVGTRRIMDDVPEEMHGIFCMSASLGESRILSRMLVCGSVLLQPSLLTHQQSTQMLCSSLHDSRNLNKCSVAIYTNAL